MKTNCGFLRYVWGKGRAEAIERHAAATAVSAAVATVVMRPRRVAAQAHIAVGREGVAEASVRVHSIHAAPRALGVGAARHL